VVAVLDGELTLKRLYIRSERVLLKAENPRFPDIAVDTLSELTIWGVVTRCLHHV
jgi:DNA polymerase V